MRMLRSWLVVLPLAAGLPPAADAEDASRVFFPSASDPLELPFRRVAPEPRLGLGVDEVKLRHEGTSKRLDTELRFDRSFGGGSRGIYGAKLPGLHSELKRRYQARGSYDLFSDGNLLGGRGASLQAFATHEWRESYEDQLVRAADDHRHDSRVGLAVGLGGVHLSVATAREFVFESERLQLERGGARNEANAHIALGQLLGATSDSWWLPSLDYSVIALDGWRETDSGSRIRTDQLFQSFGANWSDSHWSLSYNHARTSQRDRQQGGPTTDYSYSSHDVTVSIFPIDRLSLVLWGTRTEDRYAGGGSSMMATMLGFRWQMHPAWTLASSFGPSWERDLAARATTRSHLMSSELEWRFGAGPGSLLGLGDGTALLRISQFSSVYDERYYGTRIASGNWTAALSLRFDLP